jgi:hypothetical protein
VASPIAARRLQVLAAARREGEAFARIDPARLRFHLGASLADLQVPIQVESGAVALVQAAAEQAGIALTVHHKRFVPPEELDRIYLREDYAALPAIADALGAVEGGPDLRAAARLGALAHPALPGGLVCAWMGRGGRGRSLTALWIAVLRAAFEERRASATGEETPLLATLALAGALQATGPGLREVLPGAPYDRYLRAAALTALWVASRTGLARAVRDAGLEPDDPFALRLDAALNPGALLGGRGALLSGGSTLYGVELLAGVPQADEVTGRLAAGGDPDAAAGDVAAALASDEELSRRAETAVALARLREALSAAVTGSEEAGQRGAGADLRGLLAAPGGLAAAVGDEEGRRQLATRAREALSRVLSGEAAAGLEVVLRALRGWKQREPAAALGLRREQARAEYATAATALLADAALERILVPARRALVARTGAEAEGGADAEWEAGRLYRISTRGGPILKAGRERPMAHLFADVKDFTRRTGLLGQAAMAEFLRREFYLPILGAARHRFGGMSHLSDRGGVSVNNLLGDAISLSGDIEILVGVAAEIRRLLAAYETRLAREVSTEVVAGGVAALQEAHRPALEAAARARREAREAAERAPAASPERAEAQRRLALATAAEARRLAERDRAVARARGEGLEAGVFVSFGPAPLVVTIDDEVFGRNRVAIAEKINESARGTARAVSARARADQLLEAERQARGLPELHHAWSVHIGRPLTLSIPPAAEAAALRAARAGDLPTAMHVVAGPVREALEAAARADDLGTGDVYNAGAALSEEALEAFLEAVARSRTVRRVELETRDVPPDLARQAWFGPGTESLVATFHLDGRPAELFRFAGRAWFKGLGEVPVWEIAADSGPPAALFRVLRDRWLGGRGGG